MPGNISAGRLCRRACFEFVSQTSSTLRLKEDLEPLLALPAPHARSCFSAKRVQNATWEAAAAGGPGVGGLGWGRVSAPRARGAAGRVPRPLGVDEEIPRESQADQRAQADKRWRPARCRDSHPAAMPRRGPGAGRGGAGHGSFSTSPISVRPASQPPQMAFILSTDLCP